MATIRLLNLLSIATLAILACSYGSEPVNALSNHHGIGARDVLRGHDALAKRKRSNTKRCKARSAPVPSTPATTPAPDAAPAAAAVASSPPSNDDGNNSSNNSNSDSGNTGSGKSVKSGSGKSDSGNNNNSGNGNGNSNSGSSSGSSSPGPSGTSSKACLAWPNGNDQSLTKWKTDKTTGLYTWSPFIPDLARQLGFQAWPMLWGKNQIDDFQKMVTAGYANVVLGFNEPDQAGQSNMSPQEAASLWQQYIQPLKSQGYKLVSPAVTSDPNAQKWMKDFFAACGGCTFDAQAVHWYDTSLDDFKQYVTNYHNMFNLPIWVTEFAYQSFTGGAQGDLGTIQNFMGQATSWMDQQPWIEQYCWFGAMHDMQNVNPANQLMAGDGGLTSLGSQFLWS